MQNMQLLSEGNQLINEFGVTDTSMYVFIAANAHELIMPWSKAEVKKLSFDLLVTADLNELNLN